MKKLYTCLLLLAYPIYSFAQTTSTFESLPLDASGYWDGSNRSGGFKDADGYFENQYYGGYWSGGFAYSNIQDNTTAGYTNMYASYPKSGVGKSNKYAIGTSGAIVKLLNAAKGKAVTGFYVANTTYAELSMLNGDSFVKKFGGANGNTPDWFLLTITGFFNGIAIKDTVSVYLADYRFADNTKDYILNTWRWIDTRSLKNVDSLVFDLSASNGSGYNMTTPSYFAMDQFNEPLYDAAVINGGTEALFKDNVLFKSWANACTVTRGYQDIDNQALGYATYGVDSNGTHKVGINSVVSLGDKGIAILEFPTPIMNGNGPDFAVFENGMNGTGSTNQFLELAFVEVSSDGINYVRFPSISKTNAFTQTGAFDLTDAALLYNLAGKYVANYGTPFDLEELKNNSLLNINNITHVKIIDVIGTIDLVESSKDSLGNPINDPFSTPFPSSGFDLDAVGVINQNSLATSITNSVKQILYVFPNPSASQFNIRLLDNSLIGEELYIYDLTGSLITNQMITDNISIDASHWDNGIYYIRIGKTSQKIIKIN